MCIDIKYPFGEKQFFINYNSKHTNNFDTLEECINWATKIKQDEGN